MRCVEEMEGPANLLRRAGDHLVGHENDSDRSVDRTVRDKETDFGRVGEKRQVVADTSLVLGAERRVAGAEHRAEIDTIATPDVGHTPLERMQVARIRGAGRSQVQAVLQNTRKAAYKSRWLEERCRAAGIEDTPEKRPVL